MASKMLEKVATKVKSTKVKMTEHYKRLDGHSDNMSISITIGTKHLERLARKAAAKARRARRWRSCKENTGVVCILLIRLLIFLAESATKVIWRSALVAILLAGL